MLHKENIERLFKNYKDHFETLNNREHNETYKWTAIEQVQKCWDLTNPDTSEMIKQSFSLCYNLINNRVVQPVSGLIALARIEQNAVCKGFEKLLADADNVDTKQARIQSFVDDMNDLLNKHFHGKWKYEQDIRAGICYLSMIKPSENYLFKSTPAHFFAQYMEYGGDIGYGQDFKLRYYYSMCDELVEYIKKDEELLAVDRSRNSTWTDGSYHVLAYDLIYCFHTYGLLDGIKEPVLTGKPKNNQQRKYREQQAEELIRQIGEIQDQIEVLQLEIRELPEISFEGKSFKTKAFGSVTIEKQENEKLIFTFEGQRKKFLLPDCIINGYLIPDELRVIERYKKQSELLKRIDRLESNQKTLTYRLKQLQL